jgi:hypothetical protein
MSAQRDEENHHMTIRRSAAFVTAIVLVAACSSSKGASPTTPTTSGSTGTAATTVAPVAPTQPPATNASGEVTISGNLALTSGTKYSVLQRVLQRTIGFTATDTSKEAFVTPGFFGVTADAKGAQPLIAFIDLANSRVFRDPHADFSTFATAADVVNVTDAVPADFLATAAKLPGMTVGTVADTTFLGVPAKSMTYKVDSTDGAFQCGKDDPSPCLLVLFVTTGPTIALHKGDSGTFYDLQISGRRILVEVTDHPGATDLLKTFTFGA